MSSSVPASSFAEMTPNSQTSSLSSGRIGHRCLQIIHDATRKYTQLTSNIFSRQGEQCDEVFDEWRTYVSSVEAEIRLFDPSSLSFSGGLGSKSNSFHTTVFSSPRPPAGSSPLTATPNPHHHIVAAGATPLELPMADRTELEESVNLLKGTLSSLTDSLLETTQFVSASSSQAGSQSVSPGSARVGSFSRRRWTRSATPSPNMPATRGSGNLNQADNGADLWDKAGLAEHECTGFKLEE